VDVVGSDSLALEAELARMYDEVFHKLGFKVVVKINNRKVLAGMAEAAGIPQHFLSMTMAIDKLDKIGMDGVKKELAGRGLTEEAIEKVTQMLAIKDLDALKGVLVKSETGRQGVEELETVFDYLSLGDTHNDIRFDITLARGLTYYTGCIFEVAVDTTAKGQENVKMGSIGGGGRYDDLTGVFGMKGTSGVGISFGAERIYDVMEELELFPEDQSNTLQLLFIAFDEKSHHHAFRALQQVRRAGINAELYPEPAKLKKQMKYANNRKVPYTVLVGDREMETGELAFKNMASGEQRSLPLDSIIDQLKSGS